MGEKQFHICDRDPLDRIKVARVRILVTFNKLVKQQTINILSAKRMKNFRKVFHIKRPSSIDDAFVDTRQIPTLKETMETVKKRRFSKRLW